MIFRVLFSNYTSLIASVFVMTVSFIVAGQAFADGHPGAWAAVLMFVLSICGMWGSFSNWKQRRHHRERTDFLDLLGSAIGSYKQRQRAVVQRMEAGDREAAAEFERDYANAPIEGVMAGEPAAVLEFFDHYADTPLTPAQRSYVCERLRTAD